MVGISEALGKLKSGVGDGVNKFLSYPDTFKDPLERKICYIAFDLLIILAGVGMFFALVSMSKFGLSPQFLLNPSSSALMAMPIAFTAAGFGLSWLVSDILGPKNHATAKKIATVLTPILLFGACALLMTVGGVSHGSSGLHFNFGDAAATKTFLAGVLLSPLIFVAAERAYSQMTRKSKHYVEMQEMNASQRSQVDRVEAERGDQTRLAERQAAHRRREVIREGRAAVRRASELRNSV